MSKFLNVSEILSVVLTYRKIRSRLLQKSPAERSIISKTIIKHFKEDSSKWHYSISAFVGILVCDLIGHGNRYACISSIANDSSEWGSIGHLYPLKKKFRVMILTIDPRFWHVHLDHDEKATAGLSRYRVKEAL
jgi:hypothetical protein